MTLCLVMLCMQEPIDTDNIREICTNVDKGIFFVSLTWGGDKRHVCVVLQYRLCLNMETPMGLAFV